jgi:hypothetical protein
MPDELSTDVRALLDAGGTDPRRVARMVAAVAGSARQAGVKAVMSGQWLTNTVLGLVPHLPIRDEATLRTHYGKSGDELAEALITTACRTTGSVGGLMGAVATGAEASGAGIVALPAPVLADALLTALVEMKLIAELHEALGEPILDRGVSRGLLLAKAWANGRGVSRDAATIGGSAFLSGAARRQLSHAVRRRLVQRTGRSITALAPLLLGAAAAAEVNRRGTRKMGTAVRQELNDRPKGLAVAGGIN